ncbi:MAG: hypothetical protein GY906_06815, partial [bacterium]|nr:hypothetical protein [bacterium]
MIENIEKERKVSMRLLEVLLSVVRRVRERAVAKDLVHMAFEWPRGCFGWRLQIVKELERFMMFSTEFDGCCYGLADQHGELLRKPWRVVSTVPNIDQVLGRRCGHDHPHGMTSGLAAKISAYYTPAFADAVGEMIMRLPIENHNHEHHDHYDGTTANHQDNLIANHSDYHTEELVGAMPTRLREKTTMDDEAHEPLREHARLANGEPLATAPSELEQARHCLTHLPFAKWCAICVKARAKDEAHGKLKMNDGPDVVQFDYAFMRSGDEEKLVPVLIAITRRAGYAFASAVRTKGAKDTAVVDDILAWLRE